MFGAGATAVENAAGGQLDNIAKSLKADESLRLQLLAYSGGGAQTPSQARRMSLSRALAVRSRLIKEGVRSTRVDVRALGNKSEGGPPDRVDVIVTKR
jgi:outer membrane protein OmpA-like peptidoglycan-associated protein